MGNPPVVGRLSGVRKTGERCTAVANADISPAVHKEESRRTVANDRCARFDFLPATRLRLLRLLGHSKLLLRGFLLIRTHFTGKGF